MLKTIVVSFVSGSLGAVLISAVNANMYTQTLGVVDIKGIVDKHVTEFRETKEGEDLARTTELFATSLNSSIFTIAKENSVILLNNRAVISDLPDYTNLVNKSIEDTLNGSY
ncbi:MAG: hypothetical protein QM500_04590 [Methylococcales bacterium]